MVMYICNSSTSEAEGSVQVQNKCRLHSKSQDILGYIVRPCLKKSQGTEASRTLRIQGRQGLHRKFQAMRFFKTVRFLKLSQNKTKTNNKTLCVGESTTPSLKKNNLNHKLNVLRVWSHVVKIYTFRRVKSKGAKVTWELSQWDSPEGHTAKMPTLLVPLVKAPVTS